MNKLFAYSRYTILPAIFAALIGQLLMMYIGAVKVFEALELYLLKVDISDYPHHVSHADIATALLIQSLDSFLVAVVLLYFAFGLYHLFLSEDTDASEKLFPGKIAPKTIGDLKEVLSQVIIVILFILFLQEIWIEMNNLEWPILVLPISIALLAVSLKLLDFKR